MKQQICKRTVSYFLIAMMVITSLWIACPKQASAASTYRDATVFTRTVDGVSEEPLREKIAGYYFWEEIKGNKAMLKCAKTSTAKGTTLATSEKGFFGNKVVTNGTTVFFSVNGLADWRQAAIYKTTVKGGSAKKLMTAKNTAGIDVYTYYNGKLYYSSECTGDYAYSAPYSYRISTKKMKSEDKIPENIDSGYGKYITAFYNIESGHGEYDYAYLYNIAIGKLKKLAKANYAAVSGSKVYLMKRGSDDSTYTIKSCSVTGKNLKTIKTVKKVEDCVYFGKSKAIFKIKGKSAPLKVTYQ